MTSRTDVLLIDAGASPLAALVVRLRKLGYRVVTSKTNEAAREALLDPRYGIGAAVIPPDLPAADLTGAVRALRSLGRDGSLPVLVAGPKPDAAERERLRESGIDLALWEPADEPTVRFQINRALADPEALRRRRGALRVPTDWAVRLRIGARHKDARVYTVSTGGAFLATPRPSMPNSLLYLTLPLPSGQIHAGARVVMTNVPGNLLRENLPVGMGVRFTGTLEEAERAIRDYTDQRSRNLSV